MNSLYRLKQMVLSLVISFLIVACSSKPVVQELPPTAVPSDEIANLENGLKVASQNQVDILSPKHYFDARKSLEDAKNSFKKGKDSNRTLEKVALGNAYLQSAQAAADVALQNTEDVVAARKAAQDANAEVSFPEEFKSIDRNFMALTKQIENNKMGKIAKSRPELQAKYLELELKAIKENHLQESRNIIGMAKTEEAKKFAPRTLAIAEKSFMDTENYITAYRHNTMGIRKRARDTKEAANQLLKINRVAKATKSVSPEEVALSLEKEKMSAAMKQGQLDVVQEELQLTQSALDREKETKNALKETKEELEAIKLQEEKFKIARNTFSSDEAEIYKKGDALLIRLKGIEFPSSRATIQTKSYPLLSKVQKVINEFGKNSLVVIEGHTDSIGDKKTNEKLSRERALAVKEFLKSNDAEMGDQIETYGLGDEKPIAGNKTAEGRAQNRRVDVIIKPESTKL